MMRRLAILLIALVLLATTGLGYYVHHPLALPATPFEFELKQGSSLKSGAREMKQAGLLGQAWPFVWLGRLHGSSGQLKAGQYSLDRDVSPMELLEIITRGEVIQSQASIIEGWAF